MLFPCTASIKSVRFFVIVGYYKKFGFLQGFAERETENNVCNEDSSSSFSGYKKVWIFPKLHRRKETTGSVCFQWVLKVVGATIDGFLRSVRG